MDLCYGSRLISGMFSLYLPYHTRDSKNPFPFLIQYCTLLIQHTVHKTQLDRIDGNTISTIYFLFVLISAGL